MSQGNKLHRWLRLSFYIGNNSILRTAPKAKFSNENNKKHKLFFFSPIACRPLRHNHSQALPTTPAVKTKELIAEAIYYFLKHKRNKHNLGNLNKQKNNN